jgi:type 1 glutamine amidotransferase
VFTVKFTDREHPVTRGLADFRIYDELYHSLRMRPGVHVLATAFDDPKNGGTGKDEPMMWTVGYGSGRVFHTVLGHDVAAMQTPGFVSSFVRGSEWAATGVVAVQQPATSAIRVWVVTGGHDHEASFYTLFEDQPDIAAGINPHPDAFRDDMRERADVLVLYDMVQSVPERQRKNLQAFAESGKGIVVLHHSISGHQDWPWWSEELIGGRYLLKPDKGLPASSFKHDEEMFVRPVGKHPITDGVGAMHIWDETYKGLWVSPKVTLLLETDHPNNNREVAWISPYNKSRVVYIELGHARKAHEHPSYRQLVRQAVLWAAGRLK